MKKNILIFFLSAVMVTGILAGCSKLDKSKEKKIEQIIEKDSDGDGVPDSIDEEPNTPKGVKVDSKGRALDSDGDGDFGRVQQIGQKQRKKDRTDYRKR